MYILKKRINKKKTHVYIYNLNKVLFESIYE